MKGMVEQGDTKGNAVLEKVQIFCSHMKDSD